VGTWQIVTACAPSSSANAGLSVCPSATLSTTFSGASGTATFNADGTYSLSFSLTAAESYTIPQSCLSQNGTTATCSDVQGQFASGLGDGGASASCSASGGGCSCSVSAPATKLAESGTYTTSGNSLTNTPSGGSAEAAQYCVQGSTLHVQPSGSNEEIVATK
jgi:hypothetical protein